MNSKLKSLKKRFGWLIAALLVLFLAISGRSLLTARVHPDLISRNMAKVIQQKKAELNLMMVQASNIIAEKDDAKWLWTLMESSNIEKSGVGVIVYSNDSLVYWSSSIIAFPDKINAISSPGVRKRPTGWFFIEGQQQGNYRIEGFILIKRTFPYRNQYIKSSFQHDFGLPDHYEIKETPGAGAIDIRDSSGNYLFSLTNLFDRSLSERNAVYLTILYLAFALLMLSQLNFWLARNNRISPWGKTVLVILLSAAIYIFINQRRVPSAFFKIDIFSPGFFAYGSWLPSLGEYMLLSLMMFYVAQSFFTFFRNPKKSSNQQYWLLQMVLIGAYFASTVFMMLTLLNNSDISLALLNYLKPSTTNILAFLSVALQIIGAAILLIRIKTLNSNQSKYKIVAAVLAMTTIFLLLFNLIKTTITFYSLAYWLPISILILFPQANRLKSYRLTSLLIFAVLTAMYINLIAHHYIEKKRSKEQQLWAVNLASERDPAAELFLSDFETNIKSDTVISRYFYPPYFGLESYLQNTYFTGFWRNYELQITPCSSNDTLLLEGEEKRYPCMDFFDNMRSTMGVLIPGSNFYFMNQLNGRISYLGQLDFERTATHRPLSLFIELSSKIVPEGKGYPQLLLDEQASRRSSENGFSYAKYFGGKLVDRGGDYAYPIAPPKKIDPDQEFSHFSQSGYQHCAYHRYGDNYVIISFPENTLLNKIETFPYLFLLIYISGFIWVVVNRKSTGFGLKKPDFREKIQITLVLTLFGTLFLIGLWLILYNFNEFKTTLKENIEEKIRAISSEIEFRIGSSDNIEVMREAINIQLTEISDITWTDINLYDTKGKLVATSRKEIFDQGLTSGSMEPEAFRAMSVEGRAIFLHNETLGQMNFFSAYIPIFNFYDQLVGYVNLPYYSRQEDFSKEVSGFIVAFSNIYIFLILISLLIALVISNKLTAPLLRIEENLRGIELGKNNAKIDYTGEDEIGRLAKEYNKKVDELAESAALLARSERETAWKEMARQIAHEINNPLTPMKLNIQHLQRIKAQGSEMFDSYFNKVTQSLIEQIEVLSSIATAFSDFAKISSSRNEQVNLNERVKEAAFLFSNVDRISIRTIVPENDIINVIGDKDHIGRALINLIKNGIQAVPASRSGYVKIELSRLEGMARITVSDNGSGIPGEIHSQLFEPNFTTKNSGMGLGLAITKRIVENMKGEIHFKTSPDKGTTFFVDIPTTHYS